MDGYHDTLTTPQLTQATVQGDSGIITYEARLISNLLFCSNYLNNRYRQNGWVNPRLSESQVNSHPDYKAMSNILTTTALYVAV